MNEDDDGGGGGAVGGDDQGTTGTVKHMKQPSWSDEEKKCG